MRWIMALVGLVSGALFFSNQKRRAKIQEIVQDKVPPTLSADLKNTAATMADKAKTTATAAIGKTQDVAHKASDRVSGTATSLQDAAQQATEKATSFQSENGHAGALKEKLSTVHETVKNELADVGEKVDAIQDQVQESVTKATDSAKKAAKNTTDKNEPQAAAEEPAEQTTGMEHPPIVDRAAEVAERTSGNFIGNKSTRVFHAATAPNLPGEKNRVYFETEEEAVAAGFQPAANEDLESSESQGV